MFQKIFKLAQKRGLKIERPAPSRNLAAISRHLDEMLGRDDGAFDLHEIVSSVVHMDVLVRRPTDSQPYSVLVTSGMSDRDLPIPDGVEVSPQMELVLCLPPEWPLPKPGPDERWKLKEFFWPIEELKRTAIYPHVCETWLGPGHTIVPENGALAGDRFEGHLIRRLRLLPPGFESTESEDGRSIDFFGLCPLLPEEMHFKLNHGSKALEERLDAAGVTELLDPHRAAVCPAQ